MSDSEREASTPAAETASSSEAAPTMDDRKAKLEQLRSKMVRLALVQIESPLTYINLDINQILEALFRTS
jgi:hypothetical protein